MVIFQQCRSSDPPIRCFGRVWKTKVFNVDNGFVSVNKTNKQIYINKNIDSYLYKISVLVNESAFYLFDPKTRRFLCWKSVNGTMISMNYEHIQRKKHWDLCKFTDHISNDGRFNETNVNLQLAGRPGTTMQFDMKGRNISHKRIQRCLKKRQFHGRHQKKCMGTNMYLLYYKNRHERCCNEAYKALCEDKTAYMPELRHICHVKLCDSNRTENLSFKGFA